MCVLRQYLLWACTAVCLQEMLERYVHWNEDIGEWQLKCVAYTGNNMRKTLPTHSAGQGREVSCDILCPMIKTTCRLIDQLYETV